MEPPAPDSGAQPSDTASPSEAWPIHRTNTSGAITSPPAPAESLDQIIPASVRAAAEALASQAHVADSAAAPQAGRGRRRWLCRSRRVLLVLLAVWGLNAFDLGFTLHQASASHFVEMNPLAARLLHAPPIVLFAYKFSLVSAGTVILVWLRRHAVAELGCWFLLAAYFYVAVRWFVYYERALTISPDGLSNITP